MLIFRLSARLPAVGCARRARLPLRPVPHPAAEEEGRLQRRRGRERGELRDGALLGGAEAAGLRVSLYLSEGNFIRRGSHPFDST